MRWKSKLCSVLRAIVFAHTTMSVTLRNANTEGSEALLVMSLCSPRSMCHVNQHQTEYNSSPQQTHSILDSTALP